MKESTKDKVQGTIHEAKGALKEKIGHTLKNHDLEAEGNEEKVDGEIQKKVGKVEKAIEKATGT